jgi:hypothetical protein
MMLARVTGLQRQRPARHRHARWLQRARWAFAATCSIHEKRHAGIREKIWEKTYLSLAVQCQDLQQAAPVLLPQAVHYRMEGGAEEAE